jgi:hypothetical protein
VSGDRRTGPATLARRGTVAAAVGACASHGQEGLHGSGRGGGAAVEHPEWTSERGSAPGTIPATTSSCFDI